ncbi:carbonic anhydrase-like [Venturia canescens]|uniref:carbonic anhydrase-like n=1 Tax=Venturia canescens TaxID=32260 RepID=UPI001C9BECCC|nr:carbonic anhydrase-like [Venturia canescens]
MLKNTILGFFFISFSILSQQIDAGACLGKSASEIHLQPGESASQQAGNVDDSRERLEPSNSRNVERSGHDSSKWHFGYHNIPEWGSHHPDCKGKKQSPVDLNPSVMIQLEVEQPFVWTGYRKPPMNMTVVNNGHTVQLSGYWSDDNIPRISGGTLTGDYVFLQLHFHWGTTDDSGSEHTINNVGLPLEMHMVHYKKSYGSAAKAMKNKDGLAVIGILYKIDKMQSNGIQLMLKNFKDFKSPGRATPIQPFPLSKFNLNFPGEYVSYSGSLTTPPCSEIVTWIIPVYPRFMSQKQIDKFRQISLAGGDDHNNRPVMPLNRRALNYIGH